MVIGLRSKNSHRIACEYSADMMLRIFARVPLASFKVPSQDSTATVLMSESGSALYSHAMRWEFFDRNPITMVRQSAKRDRTPDALTADELKALLAELAGVYRVMVFVAATTGLRVSELLGLRWLDCDFEDGEIHLTRGIVRQHETAMKTEASRKPVPMEMGLADVLKTWRMECGYSQQSDYIFASADMDGKQPLWPNSAMEDHIRTAAI